MEKLIELLREFDDENWNAVHIENYIYAQDHMIISKRFGFIKWLVENNHIRWDVFCTVATPSSKYEDFDLLPETPREDYTNILLMDLALQDQPVDFLVSILR